MNNKSGIVFMCLKFGLTIGVVVPFYLLIAVLFEPEAKFISSDGVWADGEQLLKKRDYDMIRQQFYSYQSSCDEEVSLFRTTKMNWLIVFYWPSYLFNPKWDLMLIDRSLLTDSHKAYLRPMGKGEKEVTH
jgi:hypothetical protein